MQYQKRDYQQAASDSAVRAIYANVNGLIVCPTGAGKSLIIADIATRIREPLLIFQPSKEILEQNYAKLRSYNYEDCSIYSASLRSKEIAHVTFATIGSVNNHPEDFDKFRLIIVDEAHGINPKGGMYERFIHRRADRVVIGLTATPYRLTTSSFGCILKFLTRTRPRIFTTVIFHVQIQTLLERGYLAPIKYYDLTSIDLRNVKSNSTGADYDDESLTAEYERVGFYDKLAYTTLRVLHPKDGSKRNGVLVFTRFTKEANALVAKLADAGIKAAIVTGDTPKQERERILEDFKAGKIQVCSNVNCLSTGFDYPELDTVIMARPTKSLALYYQMCLDMETEILTKRGFMEFESIRQDDLVAAYKDGEILFVPIQKIVYRSTYDGEFFVSFKNQHLDFRVTGEHELLTKTKGAKEYKKEEALNIFRRKSLFMVPVSGNEHVTGASLTDDEIRFLGWCISDGSLSKSNNAIHIVQSLKNVRYIEEIERVIKACGLRYGKCYQQRRHNEAKYAGTIHFIISHGDPRKKTDREAGLHGWNKYDGYILGCKTWSELYEDFNEHQFDVFLEAIYMADGAHFTPVGYKKETLCICGGIHKNYCDRLQSLALRRGYRAKVSTYINSYGNEAYTLYFKKIMYATIAGTNAKDGCIYISKKEYRRARPVIEESKGEKIWCVKNEIGTIVTRRNGKILIMGNCGREIRPYKGKDAWCIDLGGNLQRFGRVQDLVLKEPKPNMWHVESNGRQLTNVFY